jgi:hypothetical protein
MHAKNESPIFLSSLFPKRRDSQKPTTIVENASTFNSRFLWPKVSKIGFREELFRVGSLKLDTISIRAIYCLASTKLKSKNFFVTE